MRSLGWALIHRDGVLIKKGKMWTEGQTLTEEDKVQPRREKMVPGDWSDAPTSQAAPGPMASGCWELAKAEEAPPPECQGQQAVLTPELGLRRARR